MDKYKTKDASESFDQIAPPILRTTKRARRSWEVSNSIEISPEVQTEPTSGDNQGESRDTASEKPVILRNLPDAISPGVKSITENTPSNNTPVINTGVLTAGVNSTPDKITTVSSTPSYSTDVVTTPTESTDVKPTGVELTPAVSTPFTDLELPVRTFSDTPGVDLEIPSDSSLWLKTIEKKQKRNKAEKAKEAIGQSKLLQSQPAIVEMFFSGGWGRFPHSLTKLVKNPKRFQITSQEVNIIFTLYDHTLAQVKPRAFTLVSYDDFSKESGLDRSNFARAAKSLTERGIIIKEAVGKLVFWALNPKFFEFVSNTLAQSTGVNFTPVDSTNVLLPPVTGVKNTPLASGQKHTHKNMQPTNLITEFGVLRISSEESSKESLSQHSGFNERWSNLPKRTREREMEVINFLIKDFPDDTPELFEELLRLEKTRLDHFGKVCASPIGLIESSWPAIKALRQEKRQKEEITKGKEREKQAQQTQKEKEARARTLEEQIRSETDVMVLEHYDNLTEEELDTYLTRVHEQNPVFKADKGTPAATGLIKALIREDLKLQEYEVRKLAELSLAQASTRNTTPA